MGIFFMCIVGRVNFYIFYEYSMKGTSFIIPLSAFLILEVSFMQGHTHAYLSTLTIIVFKPIPLFQDFRNSRFNIEFFLFFISCLLHFYTPCYYSDLLMDTCETFRQSIYSCGWEKHPDKQARQIVLFMLTRTRAPMGITTVFFSINLDTFAEMCRQSYGILNLLNASV
ncbi:odorant receptor 2a-like [Trichoplusia ni]|uniref:Odorant receptor 2a-like n=1 Tax=Trichoplusia ni TaxID=7111 RepID=A0A7E5W9Z7_TRINI|nr:odorant receptor 2a-like [Trichoplusia ni]